MQIGDTRYNVETDPSVDSYVYSVERVNGQLYVTYSAGGDLNIISVSPDGSVSTAPSPVLDPRTDDNSDSVIFKGLSDGNILVTWYSSSSGTGFTDTYFKIIDDTGQEVVGATKINSEAGSLNRFTEVAELSNGNLAFVWATGGSDYAMRRFEVDGTPFDNEQLSVTSLAGISGSQYQHNIAANDTGFIITWDAYNYNNYLGMLFDNDASMPTQVNGSNRFAIGDSIAKGNASQYVETLPNGNYLVLFKGATGDSSTRDVRYQIYDDSGNALLSSDTVIGGMNSWGDFSKPVILDDRLVVSYSYVDYNTDPTTIERYLVSYDFNGNLIEDLSSSIPTTQGEYGYVTSFVDVDGNLSWLVNDDDSGNDDYDTWLLRQSEVIPEGEVSNEAPAIILPSPLVFDENTSANAVSGLSITDGNADNQTVTLTATDGTINLANINGLTKVSGEYNSGFVTFSGELNDVNTALNSLTFTPTANVSGNNAASLFIQTADGNGGSDSQTLEFNITDVDPIIDNNSFSVNKNSVNGTVVGTVTPSGDTNGLTFSITSGNESGAFAIDSNGQITVADDSQLNNNSFSLTVAVDDEDEDSTADDTASITISVNNPPTLTGVPTSIMVAIGSISDLDLSAVSLADIDSDDITLEINTSSGALAASSGTGVVVSGSDTNTLTLEGTPDAINTYLDTVSNIQYKPEDEGSGTTLTLRASDGEADSAIATSTINVNDLPTGDVTITGDAVEDATLTASNTLADENGLGMVTYQWLRDGNEITDATGTTYTLTQADVGAAISVRASYTDGQGTAEAVTSTATSSVANVNDAPTGNVTITGEAIEDQTLTASNTLADEDGLGTVTYQWLRDGNEITAATGETYSLTQADVGAAISVRASYTDQQGTAEAVTSAATGIVANVNDAPAGDVIITGDAIEDETLTADTSSLVDEDGLGTFSYVWKADDTAITGATSSIYTLTQAEVGKAITVEVSYTDDQGTAEVVTSAATDSVANVNDAPTGNVTITGDAVEDQTLTASNTLADEDGLGTVTYQWLRDGVEITAATGETYSLTQADVGAAISVRASYTDGQGTAEAVTSAATSSVANVNDVPTGNVTITGDAIEDQTLTASNTLADEDGLGTVTYQWLRDGVEIAAATDETYTLTQADVGAAISVRASYTDGQGTAEAVTSAATSSVANVNDAPTGDVIITGDAVEDQTLTASNTLADEDGLGTVTYQWLRDGVEIAAATDETYTLTQADVGTAISVRASYTDQQGTAEAVTSATTESVVNVNDAPTGDVIITGDAVEDQTLTASNTLADEDGLGTVTYQWLRDGVEIAAATGETYSLTQADVGAAISVRASYTDQQGTAEAVTSAATESVANVNDAPTGGVAISGDAVEDQTLTASNTLADEDGLGTVTYQWLRDGNEITDATGETYSLTQADVGAAISVRASYTDQQGTAEAVTSAATSSVANVNDAPTGDVIITGDAVEDQTLTASNTLADEDGLGTVTYQWLRDGVEIAAATDETYTLTQADVGTAISVRASYTDQQGTAEAVTSATTESVVNVNDAPTGDVIITGDAVEDQTLTASNTLADEDGLGTVTYQWLRDGVEIAAATGETYSLTQADVGAAISVRASYTDGQGTAEAVTSTATSSVANVNDAPTGNVTITGEAIEDQTLTASNTLADEDGLGTVTYQWLRDGNEITAATGETYSLTQADVGAAISVRASYTDQQGTAEAVTSAATGIVANVNDAPAGDVIITGDAIEDETLTADTSSLVDEDGLGTFSYVWKADDTAITGATSSIYTLTQAEVGKAITVEVSYTDDQGTAEVVTSAATDSVANVNDAPTGNVTITGDAVEDQTLTASNTLADEDGLGTVTYQWLRDGVEITAATGETYSLTQADVGAAISVRASYTDGQGTAEAVTSAATSSVANVNDVPTGNVTITGDAIEDQTLTASNTLADEDGLGTVTYQWLRDGVEIAAATDETYTLTQADVGAAISVRASYTDGQGTAEAVTSAATSSVANVNDAPTGDVIITGDAVEDQTLTASNTLADEDGLGTVTYQWLRDGVEIAAATDETYTLTQADVGTAISVRASYTDQQGTAEAVTSATTESVVNVNDAPTGDVIITGDAVEDQTLTASNTLADEDGLGTVTYQWLRDGVEIAAATGETYSLTQADVGAAISVRASYTDQQGTAEAVTSAATESVANVNDAPTGGVAISGDAVEDQTLTASNTLADEDGLGTVTYQWLRDGNEITDATGETYSLTQADVGAAISVRASYTDQQGTAEAVTSAATESVANVNDAPTGNVTITGTVTEDETLTADTSALVDEDGLGTLSYVWKADDTAITGATNSTYTLTQAEVGKSITVEVSYTDDQGTVEAVTSAATDSVANVNDAPTGDVSITGDAVEDQTLTVSNTLADEDGLGTVTYQWLRDGNEITDAMGTTYTLTQADVGAAISVHASYTDQQGTAEAVTSAATSSVANVNDAPTGNVTITGDAVEDQTLTASNTLTDEDGMGTVTYQWLRDGNEITDATGETYTLTQADVGAAISVRASYTDQQGTAEAVTSAATISVANVNDAPTGNVTITGTVTEDETLTADTSALVDEDGLGTLSYVWKADDTAITGATNSTYTLTQAEVGKSITVEVSYTDDQGTVEAVTSAATDSVANVNDAPTGDVSITGDAVEDQTLTASNTLADEDGLGTVTYQWLRDGNEITDAMGTTYTLTQADVGAAISVRASYTDQQGTAETITSMPTSAISANPDSDNDGIPNEDENRVPSLDGSTIGDGNGDGIPDAEQSNVSSTPFLLTPTAVSNPADAPEAFITLTSNGSRNAESDDDLLTLRNVRQLDAPNDRPDDLDMPFGLIAFEADIETVGGSNVFSLFVADDVEANGYWKQNAAGDWVNLASAAFGGSLTNEGNKLRFDFVIEDGGEFDSDGAANGVIVDPGAIGFRLPETPEPPEPKPDVDDGGVNSAPIARDDEFSSRFGWLLRGNLLEDNGNGIDQEIDGDDFSITDIDGQKVLFDTALVLSSGATLTVQENGDFLYDQRGAFVPSQALDRVNDTFEYSIEDSQGASSKATVSVELGDVTDTAEISVLHALYKVAFDREADASGLNYWSGVRENGVSMFDIADFFIESEEFTDDHGSRFSDDDYLTLLYANAFDRAPDADGFAYWSDVLEEPTVDQGDVMIYFATSEEMQVKHLAEGFVFA
ncbi:hypothetical protein HHSLTHF2_34030 [Vreelandella venusta]|uniref:Cadherin domain-containing protein n=1 Tax=Halomonas hydrothermalis TaxID=115561 RepID=A0A6F8U9D0_9GAMM|nr:DUF4214 domain-containing protein [Halomonas hydrothermalis]BCB09513.1 hypothetical protein HHSLTHF2_34030 [Halomonas hydrothermalis]